MLKSLLIFIFGLVVGAVGKSIMDSSLRWNDPSSLKASKGRHMCGNCKEDGEGLIEQQAKEKEDNKKKILGLLETQNKLTNNQVEQMLDISDSTATRYLDDLEKEGKIRQIGKTGRDVYYEKILA